MPIALLRLILATLITLALALTPVAGFAMEGSCSCPAELTASGADSCPCHDSMPDYGAMPSCRTAAGCASHCFGFHAVGLAVIGQIAPSHDVLTMLAEQRPSSVSIRPPSPPPRT